MGGNFSQIIPSDTSDAEVVVGLSCTFTQIPTNKSEAVVDDGCKTVGSRAVITVADLKVHVNFRYAYLSHGTLLAILVD